MCASGKLKYGSKTEAVRAVASMRKRKYFGPKERGRGRSTLGCYYCDSCGCWHVGNDDRAPARYRRSRPEGW